MAAPFYSPSARRPASVIRIRALIQLAHDYPPTLLVAEIKFGHGSGFGCLLIRRFNGPEILPALPAVGLFLARSSSGGALRALEVGKGSTRNRNRAFLLILAGASNNFPAATEPNNLTILMRCLVGAPGLEPGTR